MTLIGLYSSLLILMALIIFLSLAVELANSSGLSTLVDSFVDSKIVQPIASKPIHLIAFCLVCISAFAGYLWH